MAPAGGPTRLPSCRARRNEARRCVPAGEIDGAPTTLRTSYVVRYVLRRTSHAPASCSVRSTSYRSRQRTGVARRASFVVRRLSVWVAFGLVLGWPGAACGLAWHGRGRTGHGTSENQRASCAGGRRRRLVLRRSTAALRRLQGQRSTAYSSGQGAAQAHDLGDAAGRACAEVSRPAAPLPPAPGIPLAPSQFCGVLLHARERLHRRRRACRPKQRPLEYREARPCVCVLRSGEGHRRNEARVGLADVTDRRGSALATARDGARSRCVSSWLGAAEQQLSHGMPPGRKQTAQHVVLRTSSAARRPPHVVRRTKTTWPSAGTAPDDDPCARAAAAHCPSTESSARFAERGPEAGRRALAFRFCWGKGGRATAPGIVACWVGHATAVWGRSSQRAARLTCCGAGAGRAGTTTRRPE